jgi:ribulose-5-phosphate 4-epimerase/fuculose-1-phosphate aldolase
LSVALEFKKAFLTLPYGILWSTAREEDFALVDFDGNILRPCGRVSSTPGYEYEPDITAIKIHSTIHKTLGKRAKAVFHTH